MITRTEKAHRTTRKENPITDHLDKSILGQTTKNMKEQRQWKMRKLMPFLCLPPPAFAAGVSSELTSSLARQKQTRMHNNKNIER